MLARRLSRHDDGAADVTASIHRFGGQACEKSRDGVRSVPGLPGSLTDGSRIVASLAVIGWGLRQAERRSRISRMRLLRWCRNEEPADPSFLAWLGRLERAHRRLASPLAAAVPPRGNRPLLSAAGIISSLIMIGWSERQLAERMGVHRTSLRRVLERQGQIAPRASRWLEALADVHRDDPHP